MAPQGARFLALYDFLNPIARPKKRQNDRPHTNLVCFACAPVSKLPPLPTGEIETEQRKQQIAQLRGYLGQLSRLDNVAFQLRVANRDDCKDRAWAQIGLFAGTVPSLPRRFR